MEVRSSNNVKIQAKVETLILNFPAVEPRVVGDVLIACEGNTVEIVSIVLLGKDE